MAASLRAELSPRIVLVQSAWREDDVRQGERRSTWGMGQRERVHHEVKMMSRMSETGRDKQAVALLDSYFFKKGWSNLEFRAYGCQHSGAQ